jgi:thiosulfate dehydrogenase [quinone] large subunit
MTITVNRESTPLPDIHAVVPHPIEDRHESPTDLVWGVLRLGMGWLFLWPFLDKLFALGFSTGRNPETGVVDRFGDAAWINGGSPTEGFLQFGLHTEQPFTDFYSSLAGHAWVDWVYMLSMVAIGVALILGVAIRYAAVAGIAWMVLFYTAAAIWPEHNPFVDDHVIEAIVLAGIAITGGGALGLRRRIVRPRRRA